MLANTAWKVSKYGVFSGPYFPVFRLNTKIYRGNLLIQTECSKIQSRRNSVFGHFSRSVKDIPSHLTNFPKSLLTMQLTCKFSIFCKGLSLGLRSDPNLMNSWRRCKFFSSILLLVTLFLRKKLDTWSQLVKASNPRRAFFFKSKS